MRMIVVVPHTHWDREWYLPFQRFRLRLVSLLDDVLDRMERDPRQHFTLDGQMAAVDDYLEIRPERRDLVAKLVREGRLAVGPWQILHDEFLCSGENIVRNLELGMRRAEEFGAVMNVGYLPDQFGHCAQTPQILRLAGIEHACVWRGVPREVRTHAFAWESPDGTAIRTEYMPEGGYGNAAGLFEDAGLLPERVAEFGQRMRPWRHDGGTFLAMYGADHTAPAADLADRIEALETPMRLDTLAGYFAEESTAVDGLPVVRGELRSHARANILPGVISARIHLKQAMGRAERLVERYAEPLAALWYSGDASRFLDMAWRRLIEVSCHDSVTGCGSDETAEQVAARMAEAEQIGQAVCDLVTGELAASVPFGGHMVFNPSPAWRRGVVVLDVPAEGETALVDAEGRSYATQTVEEAPVVVDDAVHPAADLPMVLDRVYGRVLFGQEITGWTVSEDDRTLTFEVARRSDAPFDIADVRAALSGAEGEWRVRTLAAPRRSVAALVEAPPLGHVSFLPEPSEAAGSSEADGLFARMNGRVLDNGLLRVEVVDDGTLTLTSAGGAEFTGVGRVVDGGDVGDTYNYAPPEDDRLVDVPDSVEFVPVCDGPVVAALDVVRTYLWGGGERVPVTTRVELRAGEPYARLRVTFDNRCDDHRVRLHVPLPTAASSSFAEGQFAVIERGLTAEGGWGERPVPTFPASSFVAAGGAAVLLEHVTEYEVTGQELALTLLRSVGFLSRDHNPYRDQPAGPQLATPRAQCPGERSVGFAIMPYEGERPGGDVLTAAESFRHDFLTGAGTGAADAPLPPAGTGMELAGEGVVMTSLREHDGALEARLVAEDPAASGAVVVLDGQIVRVALRPWEIAAVRLNRGDL
ncbi:alpha-mannosidase [Actinomadura barringtoniae]|uniref:Alpha-mannosidase n=1 Tax=Actinomadura barringtoniae TaxID=1427535 RepID=A0A939T8Z8_9ACTN|nr:glycoside hydrolase family 38 C-terminal domain-containing protein [Actinomadura barringtoniae]MBO2450862.1 alpha-mannosidase [Actinomadura barringtoniae]